ncbi:Signal peptidase complex catalytic subunit SEC11 [Trichostrongylus colubriformis]|uniref:Signal peptidase complex catalytic subunit SEC11 n=1 Tax=Trichostrongylus colubriformis TaxID=6319 RepID=A0AAN8F317_TRICO
MFFHLSMEHEVCLHPKYFGANLNETIKMKLFAEVEGTCTGKFGFVIAVTTIDTIGHGLIQPGRGFVIYPVKYKAIVFRPFKGQVVDAVVNQVNKVGIFCDIGPLSCFISRHCIPPDMEFDPNSNPPCYKTEDETSIIKQDDEIRVKLIGTRVDANDIFAIGTLMDDFLATMGLFDLAMFDELRRMNVRQLIYQGLNFAMVVSSALMIWKGLMVITGSESPIVVVLSGSMEPAFFRGDLLLLTNDHSDPIRAGDITVFKIDGRDIPIVHRVIKVHEKTSSDTKFLTKGDNNQVDDRGLYAPGQMWLHRDDVVGRTKGMLPYVGMVTILMNDYPKLKYAVLGLLGLFVIIHREQ